MLEDGNGVIDLDFPVTGDVGDPEFNFFQTLRQALVNAITSIVQSPSNFLANLFGADAESLGRIEFPEGRAELLPPQHARINTLRKALNQRPALVLDLAGPYNRSFDGTALQRQIAIEALQQRLAEADRDVADPSLTAEENQEIIETMFSIYYPDIDLEDVQTPFIKTQDASAEPSFDDLAYRNYLAERIIAAQFVSEADFIAIANARALAVRDALAESNTGTSTANDRVRILDPKEIESVEGEHIVLEVSITVAGDD